MGAREPTTKDLRIGDPIRHRDAGTHPRHRQRSPAFTIVSCRSEGVNAAFRKAKQQHIFPRDSELFPDRPNMAPPAHCVFVGTIAAYAGTSLPTQYPVGISKSGRHGVLKKHVRNLLRRTQKAFGYRSGRG
jgi:hypothetical protein